MAVSPAQASGGRRVLIGLNVALNIVLVLILLAFVLWFADRFGGSLDASTAGINSLSPRTRAVVSEIDEPIRITALYSTALKEVRPYAEKHQAAVADLLDLYENAGGGSITPEVVDSADSPTAVATMLRRLANKPVYADAAANHDQLLEEFEQLSEQLVEFLQGELSELGRLKSADPRVAELRPVANIERLYSRISTSASDALTRIGELTRGPIPERAAALELGTRVMDEARSLISEATSWMTTDGVAAPGITPEARTFFQRATERARQLLERIPAWNARAEALETPELEQIHNQLKRGEAILVETETQAEVLAFSDVWQRVTDPRAVASDGDPHQFHGEQAISTALLRLTQDERIGVVFVRFGGMPVLTPAFAQFNPGQPPPEAPFGIIGNVLEDEHFLAREWDVQATLEPPTIAEAASTVYVVMSPRPVQGPQDPSRPSPPQRISAQQVNAVTAAVEAAGAAIYLVEWLQPMSPMSPRSEAYAYNDYLETTWGLRAEDQHLALQFIPNPQRPDVYVPANQRLTLGANALDYGDHPVSNAMEGLQIGLPAPVPLTPAEVRPDGVVLTPLITARDTEDIWAVRDLQRAAQEIQRDEGLRPNDEDIRAPFLLAAALERGEQRIAVISGATFIANATLNLAGLVQIGNDFRLASLYPGNTEFFVNTLHWLSGDASRVAVGPRNDVPRLAGPRTDPQKALLSVFLVGIWPVLPLAAGAAVWLIRRR